MRLSARRDVAVTAIVCVLSSILIYLYLDERGRSTVKSGERALGTIVFKKRNATRRVRSGLVWERMRNDSPIYEADTLRTADLSEATLRFDDGIDLDMYENSMITLEFRGRERTLEFFGGNIAISSGAGAGGSGPAALAEPGTAAAGYKIVSGGKTIEFAEDSSAVLSRAGDSLSVEVSAGEVDVKGADGTVETVDRTATLEVDLATGTTQSVRRAVLPLFPAQNARLLFEGSGPAPISFSWEAEGETVLEVSQNADFGSIAATETAREAGRSIPLESGSWYWRVRAADGTVSAPRRFAVYVEEPPRPILPASGAEAWFRTKPPAIRFSWTRMETATAYLFEVAEDKDFTKPVRRDRTHLESITVNDLAEGTWYWRVTPLYAMSLLGEPPQRETRTVVVRRRPEMAAPTAVVPVANSLYLVQEAAGQGMGFSWLPQGEAVEYETCVSRTPDMGDAVIRRASSRPWLTLTGSEAAPLASPEVWYWAVRWKDQEGAFSPYSEPRALRGVDGALAVKLSFPPDGYVIADSLVASTRFAWKSNLDTETVFQLSSDPSFSSVDWEERSGAGTLIGRQWKTGRWFWRIKTLNADGSDLHATEARMFRVADPLNPPRLAPPANGGDLHLRGEDAYTFRWEAVPAADYYQFELRFLPEQGAEVSRFTAATEGTQVELPLGGFKRGAYSVRLQAFGLDKEQSTRLIGYLGRTDFSFKPVAHLDLVSPAEGASIAGLDARRTGVDFGWRHEEAPESAELIVARDPDFRSLAARRSAVSGSARVVRLDPGEYWWTVRAALYGLDISAERPRRFSVPPIPPLPPPALRAPEEGHRFGPDELRALDSIRFAWDAVRDATVYEFALYKGAESLPVAKSNSLTEGAFDLGDFSVLDVGEYRWTVTARAYDGKGELEQGGTTATSSFRIELPPLRSPSPKGKEKFYGR